MSENLISAAALKGFLCPGMPETALVFGHANTFILS